MPTLNEYFDKVLCINLARRTDRWENVLRQCEAHKLVLERFPGCERFDAAGQPDGNAGCTASHQAIARMIHEHQWKRTLILEDDFAFRYTNSQEMFSSMIGDVPEDWDMLYLGGHYAEKPQRRISPCVIQMSRMHCTHAYAMTLAFAQEVAPYLEDGAIDSIYCKWLLSHKCYIFQPRLAMQIDDFSDIRGTFERTSMCTTDPTHEMMV